MHDDVCECGGQHAAEKGSDFINNADYWPESALRHHLGLDLAICTVGLLANLCTSMTVFFIDVRRDLAMARNLGISRARIEEFDADVATLMETTSADERD